MLKGTALSSHARIVPTAISLHALVVPVTVSRMLCANSWDLEHRTELLISGQAICPLDTEL